MPRGRLPNGRKVELLIKKLLLKDYTIAICSTVISGDIVALLAKHNIKVISLIHELPHLIQQYSAEGKARNIAQSAHKIVFPSQYVYEKFRTITQLDHQKCHILLRACSTIILIRKILHKREAIYEKAQSASR